MYNRGLFGFPSEVCACTQTRHLYVHTDGIWGWKTQRFGNGEEGKGGAEGGVGEGHQNESQAPAHTGQTCWLRPRRTHKMPDFKALPRSFTNSKPLDKP